MHLNGLCESIAEIYEHGAELVITSDGLVYNGNIELLLPQKPGTDCKQTSWALATPMYGITPQRSEISSRLKSCATSALFALLIFLITREQQR